jgi:hypothetical protein
MKPFRETLSKLRQGACEEELTAALAEVVHAVQNTNKAGSVTLKITVTPTKGLALELDDTISSNVPKLAQPSTLLFPTVEGNLQEQNPMQRSLDLTVVQDGGTKQLNTVGMGNKDQPLQTVAGASGT